VLLSSGDNFPHLIQKRRSQLGFVTYLLNYPRTMLYAFCWVIPRRLNFIRRRFGTFYLFHLHRWVDILHTYMRMKMEQIGCSETSAYKIQTPGNYPEESIQHSERGESLKSRMKYYFIGNPLKLSVLENMLSR